MKYAQNAVSCIICGPSADEIPRKLDAAYFTKRVDLKFDSCDIFSFFNYYLMILR